MWLRQQVDICNSKLQYSYITVVLITYYTIQCTSTKVLQVELQTLAKLSADTCGPSCNGYNVSVFVQNVDMLLVAYACSISERATRVSVITNLA